MESPGGTTMTATGCAARAEAASRVSRMARRRMRFREPILD
jgi:hypothetical protein